MKTIEEIKEILSKPAKPVKIMEVCGTHTAAVIKNGIRGILSKDIRLVSGPGCPVCVTSAAYIDRLVELSFTPGHTVLSFGDMFKVKGREHSLSSAKAEGGSIRMIYSPLEAIKLAMENPDRIYVIAAVGFETTAPVYALLLQQAIEEGLENIRLLTAIKTMPAVMEYILSTEEIDGFICPGHVCSVIGSNVFMELCRKYKKPFVVSGFSAEHILCSVYEIIRQTESGTAEVKNFYPAAVTAEGNVKAQKLLEKYFESADALWRGIGCIKGSGLVLKPEYSRYDAGSGGIEQENMPKGCSCGDVILGRIQPADCALFGKECTPQSAVGPCMVSAEGACGIWYEGGEGI